jgi:ribosomal protein S18 acetylase RimI-like enzyme
VQVAPARSLDLSQLREAFNRGFSDYLRPLQLSEEAFREHLEANDIDLDLSRVAIDQTPAALALIGRRSREAWVGGMGTAPRHRRQGLGERALAAGIEAVRAAGCGAVWLEVLVENHGAIALYDKLGFEVVRDVIVWSLPATGNGGPEARPVDLDVAHDWIAAHRQSREPWQRADESLAWMRARRPEMRGLVLDRAGEVSAAVIFRPDPEQVVVLQIAAADDDSAADVLLAASGGDSDLRLANTPAGEPASLALKRLGAVAVAQQHEMRLAL